MVGWAEDGGEGVGQQLRPEWEIVGWKTSNGPVRSHTHAATADLKRGLRSLAGQP
ncbi:hypothetical protein GCM10017778_32750 [Streptomyces vinaceus]|nr:hypothetical protein GCM10017778_32750 [Streptomyces vinaceus]